MVFRDENIVVIELGSLTTRAVVGLAESMIPPSVRVSTKIGLRRPQSSAMQDVDSKPQLDYIFGDELEEAIERKEPDLEVIMPVIKGVVKDWEAFEIFL
jgi:actin-related protein 9